MNVTSLTSFALSYKEEELTIQTILATVINASVYTIPQHPPTQTIDVTHRHSGAPLYIEPPTIPILRPVPCAAYPIPPAICVRPDFKIVGVGDFPALILQGRTPDAQHVPLVALSVLLRASANAPPSP